MEAQQRQQRPERPEHNRSKSAFSFRSHKSSGSADKIKVSELTETEKERQRAKFSGKNFTNPNRAIQEREPAAQAQDATTLASLRGLQHVDWQGNAIADPDSSNPARPRLERPLDTIRSFEAAIDKSYSQKRAQAPRTELGDNFNGNSSRRSSFVGTDVNIHPRSTAAIPGPQYTAKRQPSYQRDPYDPYARGPPSAFPRRAMGSRMHSAPSFDRSYNQPMNGPIGYNAQHGYPYHGHNDSYDTNGDSVGSASDPWGNSTDPSSENSSIDRIHTFKPSDGANDAYGNSHPHPSPQYGQQSPMRQRQPIAEESWNADRGLEGAYDYQGPPHQSGISYQQPSPSRGPAPPSHSNNSQRPFQQHLAQQSSMHQSQRNMMPSSSVNARPISNAAPAQPNGNQPPRPKVLEKRPSEKRKSWLKRRFSKG